MSSSIPKTRQAPAIWEVNVSASGQASKWGTTAMPWSMPRPGCHSVGVPSPSSGRCTSVQSPSAMAPALQPISQAPSRRARRKPFHSGDPSNDSLRASAAELRAKVIGEGANLAITQAGRIEFAERGGRINTDFIDNSAGVDCSDNEVNIKIPLNREMREGKLSFDKRNKLLAKMTDEVAEIVLEDNRLQSLALSIAEAGGAKALPGYIRTVEILEAAGRLDRKVEGLASTEDLVRRSQRPLAASRSIDCECHRLTLELAPRCKLRTIRRRSDRKWLRNEKSRSSVRAVMPAKK